uniref:Proton-coupled zinc antiporter SLC30A8 n=1 Tax=Echeneis naucrates TaxID=173247 RepID=A0A665U661_ECHNA
MDVRPPRWKEVEEGVRRRQGFKCSYSKGEGIFRPDSALYDLLDVEGKIFFCLVTWRLASYLEKNRLLDTSVPQAGIPGFTGWLEHTSMIWHQIQAAKSEKRDFHAQEDREREKRVARKRLYVVSVICLVFMIGEVLEILGALLSVFTIWLVTGVLVYLAVERLVSDNFEIEGTIMLITSGCAVLANIIMALTLHQSGHGHSHGRRAQQANASVRAAFVHVVGDLLQSLSVLVSAIIIFFKPEYKIADPICTFLFSILVLCTTFTIMKDILIVLMEGTPTGVKYSEVRDGLLAVNGVTAVHNLHIWALTMNQAVLSAHVSRHMVSLQLFIQSSLADLKPGCTLCEDPKL